MPGDSWYCGKCRQWRKAGTNFCPKCGGIGAVGSYTESQWPQPPQPPWQDTQTRRQWDRGDQRRRRTPSPRARGKGKGKSGDSGTGKGRGKDNMGQEVAQWQSPVMEPIPKATASASAPLPPPPPEDTKLKELMTALRSVYSAPGQSMPPELAEAVARVDGAENRQLTRDIHSWTKQMGTARKQLAALKANRTKHVHAWTQFLEQTVQAVNKGAEQYEKQQAAFAEQEASAREKMSTARTAIRQLTAPDAVAPEDDDQDSDVELLAAQAEPAIDDNVVVLQAQKKVKTTLATLVEKLPDTEPVTPKRRAREAEPAEVPK